MRNVYEHDVLSIAKDLSKSKKNNFDFEESDAKVEYSDTSDLPDGENGPTYHLNFGKENLRLLVNSSIVFEASKQDLVPEVNLSDYKCVVGMMNDAKQLSLDSWKAKYILTKD